MNYQKIYDQLVQQNHSFKEGEYFETHHKVPRCMGGTDDTSNIVNLTAREHYIAHLLLVKITEQNGDKFAYGKMLYAFNCMKWGRCKGKRSFKFNSRLYQKIKESYSKLRKHMMKTKDNPMKNKIWIHSLELMQNKCWNKDIPIPKGWCKGRVFNWNTYLDYKILKQNHIRPQHLSEQERLLLNEHRIEEIILGRRTKKKKKRLATKKRIKQVQEIANYYMEYGFEKTQMKYKAISPGLTSLEGMLGMFSHYKQHYGINFIARNNTPGIANGSYFKKYQSSRIIYHYEQQQDTHTLL